MTNNIHIDEIVHIPTEIDLNLNFRRNIGDFYDITTEYCNGAIGLHHHAIGISKPPREIFSFYVMTICIFATAST